MPPRWFVLWIGTVNVLAFVAMAYDKRQAIRRGWRASEQTLLVLAAAGGFAGAWLAGRLVRHKTIKPAFRIRFALASIVGAAVVAGSAWAWTR